MMLFREIKLYSLIGIFNTLLHALVFFILVSLSVSSAWANIGAFIVAATFSFFANAKWTFNRITNKKRYALFMITMGGLALITGWLTDYLKLPPMIAVILFSFISWIVGFIFSKKIIFK